LIEDPTQILNRLTRARVLLLVLLFGVTIALVCYGGADGALLSGMFMGEALGWFLAFDVSIYMDLIILVWLNATLTRVRGVAQWLGAAVRRAVGSLPLHRRIGHCRAASHARLAQRRKMTGSVDSANDDEPAPALALAA
jgi:hypothetical protein